MTTQVSFKTTPALKRAAMSKAKDEGITLKAFFVKAMEAFVANQLRIGLTTDQAFIEVPVTPNIQRKMNHLGAALKHKLK